MSAKNSAAAAYLKVDPEWLATGKGEMRSAVVWPFGTAITPAEFFSLEVQEVQPAIDPLRCALERRRAEVKLRKSAP